MNGEYYKTEKGAEEYIKLAADVDSRQLIEKLKNYLPQNSYLLEIGSGPGTDWNILNQYYKVIGSDNSLQFLSRLKAKYPDAEFLEIDAVTLETDKFFDGLYSNKVLHHLSDKEIESSIKKEYDVLNSKGIICHSFWNGEGSETFKGLFVNYQNITSLKNMFADFFDILLIEKYKEFEEDDSILLIAKKR